MRCVDGRLLKSHNLICPEDYITEQSPLVKAPQGTYRTYSEHVQEVAHIKPGSVCVVIFLSDISSEQSIQS